jgi:hypothetical protein
LFYQHLCYHLNFTAGVRKEEQESALKDQGVNAILIDVEKDSIDDGINTLIF